MQLDTNKCSYTVTVTSYQIKDLPNLICSVCTKSAEANNKNEWLFQSVLESKVEEFNR